MKNTHIYRCLAVASAILATVVSCLRIEEQEIPDVAPKVHMIFNAEIEGKADTKTVLGGNMGDEFRKVLWEPGDSIGVSSHSSGGVMDKFVNTNEQLSSVGTFEGSTNEGSEYYMLYPYSSSAKTDNGNLYFNLSSSQIYKKDSFASDAMPMFAKGSPGNKYRFYSLCGVFAINLTGSETVTSVSFSGKDTSGNYLPVSGDFIVSTNYEEFPEAVPGENKGNSVSLICNEGVTLDPSVPTSFYIVLPVATYESFTIMISTADGKVMMKEVNKTLEIKRSNVTQTASLAYVASEAINLSETGWANCYVVSEQGIYSFDATVIGNGDFGMVKDAGFHTTSTSITPTSAEVIWEDRPGVIVSHTFDGKRINFMTSGVEGNALVAAKDADGTILWSWHIWATDKPADQIYENSLGTFTVMDRNVGAISSNNLNGYLPDSMGLAYFWGRKDPFLDDCYMHAEGFMTLLQSISNPTMRHKTDRWTHGRTSWLGDNNHISYLWSEESKTIYDPCPLGYRVAVSDIWAGFTSTGESSSDMNEFNVKGTYNDGWEFYIDESKTGTAWYPAHYWMEWGSGHYFHYDRLAVWSSDYTSDTFKCCLYSEADNINPNNLAHDGYGLQVRCMKDEGYVNISLPQVEIKGFDEITTSSAEVVVNVKSEGASEIIERGILWGTSEDLSDAVKVNAGSGSEEYSCGLTGLTSGTIYYVKAYAVNAKGESQSAVRSFSTRYSDSDAVDLSKYETANTYIVSSPGLYVFNCLVKGNSTESVGTPVSAAVVWETKNTNAPVSAGDIIDNVELHGGYLSFEIPTPFTPGNALVAVKDASGDILWSWHIWVADFDPDLTAQTYISGAVMMDRNLGALRSTPGDPSVNGFFYQWGRKDPLLSAYDDNSFISTYPADVKQYNEAEGTDQLTYTIQNPSTVVYDLNNRLGSWATSKTMYDPCPAGWRVPEGGPGVWEGITEHEMKDSGYYFHAPYSTPEAYYPGTGYTNCSSNILYYRSAIYLWSCTHANYNEVYHMCMFFDTHDPVRVGVKQDEHPIRCQMMEPDYSAEITDMVSESQSSVTVIGKVSIVRNCKIDEKGVVYSTTNPLPTIDNNDGKVKSDSTDAGEFECTINGIKRQTKYYIRPYVSGDKGVKYGKVMEYIERTPGSGEGFTGDDFVWE